MIKVGIVGATGYTAGELLRILVRHHSADVVRVTSRKSGEHLTDHHPELSGQITLPLVPFDVDDFVQAGIKCAFSCLPHAASAATAVKLNDAGIKVVDFSADFRLNDWQTFEQLYGVQHPSRERVGAIPYGLPELFRDKIADGDLIANPGCFPTSAILPLVPLIAADLVETSDIIIDSKTGVSGAGRSPKPHLHFPECNESVSAYAVGTHRHGPEIEHIIERKTGKSVSVVFTPHLIPMDRGILSTLYLRARPDVTIDAIKSSLANCYQDEPFVRIHDNLRPTKAVSRTNYCDINVQRSGDRIVITSSIDNLIKGASGAAVQNFNLMFGLEESTGLRG